MLVNHFAKTIDHHYSLLQYIIILFSCYSVRVYSRMCSTCALINSLIFVAVLYFKNFKFTWCAREFHLRIALNWIKYTLFYLKYIHVLLFKLHPKFLALGTKYFLKKILKKTSKFYCSFLWVGFTCLEATEPLRRDNFLFNKKSPGVPVLI